jgi:hypothetical protein
MPAICCCFLPSCFSFIIIPLCCFDSMVLLSK